MNDLKKRRVDLPTSVLVNLRELDPLEHLDERGDPPLLRLDGGDQLYIVDGQHRVEALKRLIEEDEEKWSQYEVPFVSMLGASEREEIRQFYVVNSTAKSVRTDLAYDLLKQRAESEPGVMDSLTETNETWKVRGQQIVEDLEKMSPLWRGRVRFPGDAAAGTVIGSSGLVGSLQPLLNTPYFGALTTVNQVKILEAYWQGIQKILPEAFGDPTEYALQKSVGVQVLHTLLLTVLEHVRASGRSVIEPEPYADVVEEALLKLEGDNRSGAVVRGSDFWLAGAEGGAGTYSSNAGRRVLTAKIRNLRPEIDVE
ncbi:DGQHR domain-containing protein [Modestobacter sp. I12A-02662]|uniref:DGQHR domain-containing protein n=1 Tax=Modestobacter sp. I12A-02662 TaxID=1730496 RepID=UPI0034DE4BC4